MAKDNHTLAGLIDAWLADYGMEEFQDAFGLTLSEGEMIQILYESGEIPEDVIAKFMED